MVSFVIPVYNEKESIESFYKELIKVVPQINKNYEIIFIDDGSTDDSLKLLKLIATKNSHVRLYSFRRNLGKSEALTYGFIKAKGDYIITLDADLQDKPSEINKLYKKAKSGSDLVCGWRRFRQDKKKSIFISKIFNSLMEIFFNLNIHDYNCGLKVYSKEAAKNLRLYGGLHRFIPLLVYQQGFNVDEVEVEHQKRKYGKSKYGFSKLWKDLPDIFSILFITKYRKRPLHFFGVAGGIFILIGLIILIDLTIQHFMGYAISRRPILFFGMVFVLAGFQLFFTGFLADLMINIAHEPQLLDERGMHYPIKYSSD